MHYRWQFYARRAVDKSRGTGCCKFILSTQASWGNVSAANLPIMYRQTLICWSFFILSAGCVIRAEAPDTAVVEVSIPTPDVVETVAPTCEAPKVPGCSEPSATEKEAICDPVCQTGQCNWCASEKCIYTKDSRIVCAPKSGGPNAVAVSLGGKCLITNEGKAEQTDNCAPGLVCLTPYPGGESSYCHKLCRITLSDCPEGKGEYKCTARPLSHKPDAVYAKVYTCNLTPYYTCGSEGAPCCDPSQRTNNGCTDDQYCRLIGKEDGKNLSVTTCDYGAGGTSKGACSSHVDCMPTYSCLEKECRRVCDPTKTGVCTSVQVCKMDKFGAQYGVCDPP